MGAEFPERWEFSICKCKEERMATAALIPSDEQIQKDVLAELKWDARVRPNEIGVAVKTASSNSPILPTPRFVRWSGMRS
jgi:hypothetical protein